MEVFNSQRQYIVFFLLFFAVLTVIKIGPFSLSFLFGVLLILTSIKNFRFYLHPHGTSKLLILFAIISLLSLVLSPLNLSGSSFIRFTQQIYWTLLAMLFYNSYDYIDKEKLSKIVFVSLLSAMIVDIMIIPMPQNHIAFNVIIMGPLGYFFLKKFHIRLIYGLLLVILMIINGSRTGAILSFFQFILFVIMFNPILSKKTGLILTIMLFIVVGFNIKPARIKLGEIITPVNMRVGEFLKDPEKVFRNDMSWLQRKAQINKGIQIFHERPLLGIGIFNFSKYYVNIDVSNIDTDRARIRNIDYRSSHNTYIALLAETGLLGFSIIIVMFSLTLLSFLRNLKVLLSSFESCVFISLVGLLIYFYFISGFFGTSAWIIYGLILGASESIKSKEIFTLDQV